MSGSPANPANPPGDPETFAAEFLEKLAPRKRHVVFLLGAGAGKAVGLPDVAELAFDVGERLEPNADLKAAYETLLPNRNIEEVLTRVRLIASLLEGSSDRIDGLDSATAHDLDGAICSAIHAAVGREPSTLDYHRSFGTWLGRAEYDLPVEVFTVNYDLLIERGLEAAGAPYFDGFVGVFEAKFRPDLIDVATVPSSRQLGVPAGWTRVWKLHGSISWRLGGDDPAVRRSARPVHDDETLAIYPSLEKYEESRRTPFVTLFDRFRKALETPETVAITCGYSFTDQHVNEALYDAAERFPRSEVVALIHSDLPDELVSRAKTTPNLTAAGATQLVIGTRLYDWQSPKDAAAFWNSGKFAMGDFQVLPTVLMATWRGRVDGGTG